MHDAVSKECHTGGSWQQVAVGYGVRICRWELVLRLTETRRRVRVRHGVAQEA